MNNTQSLKLWFDRILTKSTGKQFLVLGVLLLVLLGLSYLLLSISGADWDCYCYEKDINKWLLPLYLLIDSNALNGLYFGDLGVGKEAVHGWMLFVSSMTFLMGAFVFNGIIIGIITNSIERRVDNHRSGHIHYLKSGHYIILGYDEMIPSIITHIFEKDENAYVLLMSAAKSEQIRERLRKVFNEKQLEQIIINYGHRTSKDFYEDIHLEAAKQVYIVGLRTLPSHDAINVECVDKICDYLEQPTVTQRPERITCVFEDLDTYAAFKTSEIFGRVKNLGIEFVPYNFYADWAKQVFVNQFHKDIDRPGKIIHYPSVYGSGYSATDPTALTEKDERYIHLVFVGTTNFAVAFAMEAAQMLHLPNGNKKKTLITFIDLNADIEKEEFIVRNRSFFEIQSYYYQDLTETAPNKSRQLMENSLYFTSKNGYTEHDANFLDVEFEFIKGDIFSNTVQTILGEWANEHNIQQYLSIFLAMPNQHKNFAMGMNMPSEVYDRLVPVFICQDRSDNFVSNLREADQAIINQPKANTYYHVENKQLIPSQPLGGRYANIYPFGMNETAYSIDDTSFKRAKLINYLYCTMTPEGNFQSLFALSSLSTEQIWSDANKFWNNLTVALKWSNLYNAYSLYIKLAILRSLRGLDIKDSHLDLSPLSDGEVEILAKVEHNRWNVEKLLMGYRKPHLDEDKYRHNECASKLKLNKNRFIHHDIRPYEELDGVKMLDIEFSRYIPWILKMTEK